MGLIFFNRGEVRMVKRKYFLSVKKNHGDGNGSYSYSSLISTQRSWFSDSELVFSEMVEHLKKDMSDKPGDGSLEVVCFSRI